MKHAAQHATVLGSALIVAGAIVIVARGREGGSSSPGDPRTALPGPSARSANPVRTTTPAEAEDPRAPDPVPDPPTEPEGPLVEAERHFRAAAELYRDAAGRDDAQEDLKLARRRLDEAQRILRDMPGDAPGAKDLRLKVQELLQNVIKDSGL